MDQLGLWNDRQESGMKRITEAVRREGCRIVIQLNHAGVNSVEQPSICSSDFSYIRNGRKLSGREMTEEETDKVRDAFVKAAVRAERAGYDGIELHACHRYLLCQFLNKRINTRRDRYGEEEERFILEIVRDIRARTSPDFLIGVRLGAFEPELGDGIRHAEALDGSVDFLDISYGFSGYDFPCAPKGYPYDPAVYGAEEIKKAVRTKVFAANGITSGADAAAIRERTSADMIGVGRSCLIDPAWPNHVRSHERAGKCLKCRECKWEDPSKRDDCPGKRIFERGERT